MNENRKRKAHKGLENNVMTKKQFCKPPSFSLSTSKITHTNLLDSFEYNSKLSLNLNGYFASVTNCMHNTKFFRIS